MALGDGTLRKTRNLYSHLNFAFRAVFRSANEMVNILIVPR